MKNEDFHKILEENDGKNVIPSKEVSIEGMPEVIVSSNKLLTEEEIKDSNKLLEVKAGDGDQIPYKQLFTIEELKVINNIFQESGVPSNWICGNNIIKKINIMIKLKCE